MLLLVYIAVVYIFFIFYFFAKLSQLYVKELISFNVIVFIQKYSIVSTVDGHLGYYLSLLN